MDTTNMDSEIDQGGGDPGAHLDGFRVADDEPAPDSDFVQLDDEGEPIGGDVVETMSLEAWTATWELAWNLPGMMAPKFAPLGITSDKRPASNAAAQAVFELAQDHFPWMVDHQGGVFGAVLAIGPFAMMQFGAYRQIQAADRAAAAELEAANDNQAPTFTSKRAANKSTDPYAFLDEQQKGAA